MSPFRPDLVDCWIFREAPAGTGDPAHPPRARDGSCPGSGSACRGRSSPANASPRRRSASWSRRPASTRDAILGFYDLDLVNQFHEPSFDARRDVGGLRGPGRRRRGAELSHEHDGARWLPLADAHRDVVWPGYRTAIERIRDDLADPDGPPGSS